jgi:hypothetical protein
METQRNQERSCDSLFASLERHITQCSRHFAGVNFFAPRPQAYRTFPMRSEVPSAGAPDEMAAKPKAR